MAKLVLSAFVSTANPKHSTTFNNTDNFTLQSLADNNGAPVLIDDTSITKTTVFDTFIIRLRAD